MIGFAGRVSLSAPMKTYVIIHGTKGSPDGNWFPWLARELEQQGHRAMVPRMPTPEGQSLEGWLSTFAQQVAPIDANTTLIGHSLGATFLLRLLERLDRRACQSVFVAGPIGMIGIPEFDALNATFIEGPFDWATIRRNAGRILCFSGEGDPYVPAAQTEQLSEGLGVPNYIIPKGRHLNSESGHTSFTALLESLDIGG
jgi:predicted alpha/beta hydrolase family esterase